MANYPAARFFIEGLNEAGIEYLFANLGTDHVTLVDELARCGMEGRPAPKVLLCPHENVAIHMAAGYAAMTGRGQGVMVHVDAGTANAAMGMHNLARARLPAMLMAGRAPFTMHGELTGARDTYVHYVQDPFDIGSLVRPYVKWEYNLPAGVVAKEVIRRGHTFMQSDPPGPVYLTLPRETLAEEVDADKVKSYPESRYGATALGGVSTDVARGIARELLAAQRPLVITSYLGRKAEAVHALDAFARRCGVQVVEFSPAWLCISRDSPCFAGFDPAPLLAQADLVLLLDVDVPWLPQAVKLRDDTRFIQVDVDPVKQNFPAWGFGAEVRIAADCALALRDIHAAVDELADDEFGKRVADRIASWAPQREQRVKRIADAAAHPGEPGKLNAAHVCAVVGKHMRPDDVLINEGIRNAPVVFQQVHRTEPLSLLGGPGGGLGYSAAMALGVRLARPGIRAVHIEGDGGFHFSTPSSVYAVAQAYKLPIFTVVLDNGGWSAVKEATLRVHPSGPAAASNEFCARLEGEHRNFEMVAQAFGAHGERVTRPEDLEAAVVRCFEAIDAGRAAVLVATIATL